MEPSVTRAGGEPSQRSLQVTWRPNTHRGRDPGIIRNSSKLDAKRSYEVRGHMRKDSLTDHAVVSHKEWIAARTAFLSKEKEFTHLRDELSQQRRDLPWEAVTKSYVFEGPDGKATLADLFEDRSQLIVYH